MPVADLDTLGLTFFYLVHIGDEGLLAATRTAWTGTLIVNRAGGSRERIGKDVEAGLADIEPLVSGSR
jgi:hypothetical protein